jgi:hypothetical protein
MLSVTRDGLASNAVPFAVGDLPEVAEAEATTAAGKPQDVPLPVVVNGRIRAPGEVDAYRFVARRDQPLAIDVRARRLGSPLDSRIVLVNCFGDKIAENDDVKDRAEGFLTHQADSGLLCRLPSDGTYTLRIADAQGKGGDDYGYRLRISPAMPDFELRATPSEVSVPRAGSAALTIHAIRRDGFAGEIRLAIDEPYPAGLTLEGATIPERSDRVRMTVSASASVAAATLFPALRGTATINGKPVVRPVVPADEFMQAFAYQHLVSARAQVVKVSDALAPFTVAPQLPRDGALALARGRETTFQVAVTRRPGYDGPIRIALVDPPKGIVLHRGFVLPGRDFGMVAVLAENTAEMKAAGDNLILSAVMVLPEKEAMGGSSEPGKGEKPAEKPPKIATPGGADPGKPGSPAGAAPAPDGKSGAPAGGPAKGPGAAEAKTGTGSTTAAAGGKDGKGAPPAAGKTPAQPETQKKIPQFQRFTVTLPAVPFRLPEPPPGRAVETTRNVDK